MKFLTWSVLSLKNNYFSKYLPHVEKFTPNSIQILHYILLINEWPDLLFTCLLQLWNLLNKIDIGSYAKRLPSIPSDLWEECKKNSVSSPPWNNDGRIYVLLFIKDENMDKDKRDFNVKNLILMELGKLKT